MADEAPKLDEIAKNAPPTEEKKEEKGTLESVIDELWSFGRKAIAIGSVVAMPYLFNFIEPAHVRNAQVFAYTLSAGHATSNVMQKKPALDGVVKQAAISLPMGYQIAKTFQGLNTLETRIAPVYGPTAATATKVGTWLFAGQPAAATTRTVLNYGFGKKFRQEWWPTVRDTFLYLGLPSAINVAYLYKFGLFVQMAVSGFLSYLFGFIHAYRGGEGSIKNLFTALNPIPYIGATASVTYKLARNTTKGLFEAVYAIGSGISDLYKTSPKPEPKQEPVPATAGGRA